MMFEEMVQRILGDTVSSEFVLGAERGEWPTALWSVIEENGLTIAATPEECGGVGATWADAFPIVAAAGWHAVPVPLVETLAANWLLGRAGGHVVAGAVTLGSADGAHWSGDRFSGHFADVPWARAAGHILTWANGHLLLIPIDLGGVAGAANIAGEPRDTLHFDRVSPVSIHAWSGDAQDPVPMTGAMVRAAQIAGALDRISSIAIAYAGEREQFGRAISKFQAVQQQLAVLAEQAALARSAAYAAFATAGTAAGSFYAAAAKQVCSEVAGEGASIAHAVVGAIGFAEEFDLQLLTRRLWSWRSEFGSARYWADRLGAAAATADGADLWARMVSGQIAITVESEYG